MLACADEWRIDVIEVDWRYSEREVWFGMLYLTDVRNHHPETLFLPLLRHSPFRVRRCQKISASKKCLNPESNRGLARVKGVI